MALTPSGPAHICANALALTLEQEAARPVSPVLPPVRFLPHKWILLLLNQFLVLVSELLELFLEDNPWLC